MAKVALTGSTATGEHVHEVTCAHFKHLTLELSGKSPTIICDGADLEAAARGTVAASWRCWSGLRRAGTLADGPAVGHSDGRFMTS